MVNAEALAACMTMWHGSKSGNNSSRGLPPSQAIGGRPKSADVKEDFTIPPPSANTDNWRRGSNFPRDMQIFPHWGHHLVEGGQISEKKASPWLLRPLFGGGVAWLDCCPIRRVLNPA